MWTHTKRAELRRAVELRVTRGWLFAWASRAVLGEAAPSAEDVTDVLS